MTARVAVVVATRDRAAFLPELVAALAAQTRAPDEVVVVDDGSSDETPEVLTRLRERGGLPLTTLRHESPQGPSAARAAGVAATTSEVLAFTDDDCVPEPGWLAALAAAAETADLVQGRTRPAEASAVGPWDRTIWVDTPTGLYETCNLAVRRAAFDGVGGFPRLSLLAEGRGGRGFGEDAALGAAIVGAGGRVAWAADAVVAHRWLPGRYADHLSGRWRMRAFPGLARVAPQSPPPFLGVFHTRRTAAVDLAVVGVAVAAVLRHPLPLLGVLPWLRTSWPTARAKARGRRRGALVRLAQLAVSDVVGLSALVVGSARHRRLRL